MLNEAKALQGFKLSSLDGEIGTIKEFYFDDHYWTIRYLVVDTGDWLTERKVLISPHALRAVDKDNKFIEVNLTKKQIEESPALDTDKPVSRQFEELYHGYFEWPVYWDGPNMWGVSPNIIDDGEKWNPNNFGVSPIDLHLRSTQDVSDHIIQAIDGEIGHIDDFVIDSKTWAIRYIIVDTMNWWPGKKVLVSPKWIENISWLESKVYIDLSKNMIKECPEYTKMYLVTRDFEDGLHRHYKRPGYWVDESSNFM